MLVDSLGLSCLFKFGFFVTMEFCLIMIFGFEAKYASEAILGFSLASFIFSWLVLFHGSKISPSRNAFFSIIIVTIVLVGLTGMVLLSLINLKSLKKLMDRFG